MENFQLSVFFKITGMGSASGLHYQNDKLYIISDNSTYLYEYQMVKNCLKKIALVENAKETIAKKDKPDFESIAFSQGVIYLLASGSTKNRNRLLAYSIETNSALPKDMSSLYQKIRQELGFSEEEFNIEGLILKEEQLYLFQRGNGAEGKNGIITVYNDCYPLKITYTPFELPKTNKVRMTFTDAILVDDTIYFLAAAEDSQSTYHDGNVLGSSIGTIALKTMKLKSFIPISETNKFEGLTLYRKSSTHLELLLCEDSDSEKQESDIYKLVLRL